MRADATTRAIRRAYDAVASDYARLLPDMTVEAPQDRALLDVFVEMVRQSPDGVTAEVGCGSGRVTVHLAKAGLRMVGLDLSPGMVDVARSSHPGLAFAVADASALPIQRAVVAGLVAWYSLINLPSDALPSVFTEFARVMRPGAPIIAAYQCGEGERVDRTTAYGHPVPLTYYRHRVDDMNEAFATAGFAVHRTVRREPELPHETTPQAFVLAQRHR